MLTPKVVGAGAGFMERGFVCINVCGGGGGLLC